jgi:hypothetical protein
VAGRAAERRGQRLGQPVGGRHTGRGDPGLGAEQVVDVRRPGGRDRARAGELAQQRADPGRRAHQRVRDLPQRVGRHGRVLGVRRVLHHRDTAARDDRGQPGRTVVAGAGQHHADGAGPVREGGRAEQRVDRRPVAVLRRAGGQVQAPVDEQDVVVGGCDVHDPVARPLAVLGGDRAQRPGAVQDLGQCAGRAARDVQHDHDRGGQLRPQPAHHRPQCLDPAGRGTDHDHPAGRAGVAPLEEVGPRGVGPGAVLSGAVHPGRTTRRPLR